VLRTLDRDDYKQVRGHRTKANRTAAGRDTLSLAFHLTHTCFVVGVRGKHWRSEPSNSSRCGFRNKTLSFSEAER
jgi:hypothetical protein